MKIPDMQNVCSPPPMRGLLDPQRVVTHRFWATGLVWCSGGVQCAILQLTFPGQQQSYPSFLQPPALSSALDVLIICKLCLRCPFCVFLIPSCAEIFWWDSGAIVDHISQFPKQMLQSWCAWPLTGCVHVSISIAFLSMMLVLQQSPS